MAARRLSSFLLSRSLSLSSASSASPFLSQGHFIYMLLFCVLCCVCVLCGAICHSVFLCVWCILPSRLAPLIRIKESYFMFFLAGESRVLSPIHKFVFRNFQKVVS